ncbi:MAG: MGMT family protein [Eggerthellaceae bacterium]|nr:MGMT family protein [Eggerthellaceae bacterium]
MGEFADKVFAAVCRIPRGKVATYGQIAKLIGAPRSARYVGYALRANPSPGLDPNDIPCHRVVFKDGAMATGFAFGGPDVQKKMLEGEGVSFIGDKVDMESCLWDGLAGNIGFWSDEECSDARRDDVSITAPPSDFDWSREMGESD